ncbi:MAG TPA: prolipoprotein diacylglyceryl transferase [Clostridiales bacterium]|nr:prolipoprotein diacylglyceryl transferase [Clostridiales bacterium]
MSKIAFEIFGIPVAWYGILIALGILIGIILALLDTKRRGLNPETLVDFLLILIPVAIVGARLYYVLFKLDYYLKYPKEIFATWHGGLAIYGGVLAGIIAAIIFARARKISFWTLADILSPSLIFGQAIGRWGNFINQEAYGYEVTNKALQWFPFAVNIDGRWHLATFFYESAWNFIVFAFLMWYKKKTDIPGRIFICYLGLYGIGRFFIEGLRTDSLMWGPLRVSQVLSAVLVAFSVIYILIQQRQRKQRDKEKEA